MRSERDHRVPMVVREYRSRYGHCAALLTQDMGQMILKALVLDIALSQMDDKQPLSNTLDLYRQVVEAANRAKILRDGAS